MYTNFLFVYPASFVGKVTSTKEVNIFLEQVSEIFVKLLTGWYVSVISPLFSCYLGLFNQSCLMSDPPPQNSLLSEKKERSAHKAGKSTLVIKLNTAAPTFILF